MPDAHSIREGTLYWCDTARSNIGTQFSDKARRPVLLIARFGDYAAVYPCSRFRDDLGESEWVGDVYGEEDTHVVYGSGLFYVPTADLQLPGVPWPEWASWKKAQRKVLAGDLQEFTLRHRERLSSPTARRSGQNPDALTSTLQDRLDAKTRQRLRAASELPPPPPPMPPKPSAPPRKKEPGDEFVQAVESLPSYLVLKPEDAEESPFGTTMPSKPPKRLKRKGRRQ